MLLLWNWEHIPVLILGPLIITLSLSRSLSFSSTLSIPKHYYLLPYLYYLSLSLFPFTFTLLSPKHYLYYLSIYHSPVHFFYFSVSFISQYLSITSYFSLYYNYLNLLKYLLIYTNRPKKILSNPLYLCARILMLK